MSYTTSRMLGVLLVVGLLTVVGSSATALEISPVAAQPQPASPDQNPNPIACNPVLSRVIEPLIVEEGSELSVHVEYNFKCTGEDRKVNFFLVVEGTGALRPGGKLAMLNNVKKALQNFVNQVNYRNGSQGGLTLYADDYSNRVTLRGGEDGREALLGAIGRISPKPVGNAAGAASAVRDTTQRLPTSVEDPDATNVLLIVDAGATLLTAGQKASDLSDACKSAHQKHVTMILVGLPAADGRMGQYGCVSSGWYRGAGASDGSDLPQIFNDIAERLLKGKQANAAEYYDHMNTAFDYVPGSANPMEPDNFIGTEYSWTFPPPGPGGQLIEYRVVAKEDQPEQMTRLSIASRLVLYYLGGGDDWVDADNPQICIHRVGNPSFCDPYKVTLTPPAPTNTPAPDTPTPTESPPTQTPTVVSETPTLTPTPHTGAWAGHLLASGAQGRGTRR